MAGYAGCKCRAALIITDWAPVQQRKGSPVLFPEKESTHEPLRDEQRDPKAAVTRQLYHSGAADRPPDPVMLPAAQTLAQIPWHGVLGTA